MKAGFSLSDRIWINTRIQKLPPSLCSSSLRNSWHKIGLISSNQRHQSNEGRLMVKSIRRSAPSSPPASQTTLPSHFSFPLLLLQNTYHLVTLNNSATLSYDLRSKMDLSRLKINSLQGNMPWGGSRQVFMYIVGVHPMLYPCTKRLVSHSPFIIPYFYPTENLNKNDKILLYRCTPNFKSK